MEILTDMEIYLVFGQYRKSPILNLNCSKVVFDISKLQAFYEKLVFQEFGMGFTSKS